MIASHMPKPKLNGPIKPCTDWAVLTPQCIVALNDEKLTWPQLSERTGVAIPTLQSQAKRHNWPVEFNHKRLNRKAQQAAEAAVVTDWLARGEKVREEAFRLSFGELKKKKKLPIRNWRDAETADKMARRAAGLENESVVNQTLISINERINAAGAENDDDEVTEATDAEFEPMPALPSGETPGPAAEPAPESPSP